MKKLITLFSFVFAFLAIHAQTNLIKLAPPINANTASRAPNGSAVHAHLRASTIVRASELSGVAAGTSITMLGFNLLQGAIAPVSGNMKIYMMNTTNTTYAISNVWTNIIPSMTLVYDGPYTVPAQDGPYNLTLNTPFNYTGGGVYVAYEFTSTGPFVANHGDTVAFYYANSSLANSLWMRNSSTTITNDTLNATTAFRPAFNFIYANPDTNEVAILNVVTLGKIPSNVGVVPIQVVVRNQGSANQTNIPVSLNVTGANTYSNTITINTLDGGEDTVITFLGFMPAVEGQNTITVNAALTGDENMANNTVTTTLHQEFTCNVVSYSDTSSRTGAVGLQPTGSGLLLAKYMVLPTASNTINAVNVFLGSSGINEKVFAVVVDQTGAIVATSDTLTISASDTSTLHTFMINNPPTFNGGLTGYTYYVGLAQTIATQGAYFPLGRQSRTYVPGNTFFVAGINGGNPASYNPYTTLGVWMIEAVLAVPASQLPSTPGTIAGQSNICTPETAISFTVPAVTGADSYVWTIPAGATIVGSSNTNTISVNFPAGAASGVVSVAGVNNCGPGPVSTFNVVVNDQPTASFTHTSVDLTYTFVNNSTNATSYLWDLGNGDTSTAAVFSYTFTQNGTYNVCLTAMNGPCDDQTCETIVITGIGINETNSVVSRIYPNPAKDVLTIEVSNNSNDLRAALYNSVGQIVAERNIENGTNTINIAHLPAGVYHLELFSSDIKNTSRIVIQK